MKRLLFAMLCIVSALGMRAQTWTASEVGAGNFYLYNIGKGQFLTRGNGWGTQASVSANSALSLTVEEYNGAYKLRTNIQGDGKGLERLSDPVIYTDQSAGKNSTWTFTKVADASNGPVYTIVSADNHGGGSGSYMTASADNTIVGPADAVNDDYGRWQLVQSWITNSIPVNDATGWTTSQTPTFDGGNVCAEFWNKSAASIKQTVSNLPAGAYELIAVAFTREGMTATLNAGTNTMSIATVSSSVVNGRGGANTWFNNGNGVNSLKFTLTEETPSLEIGLTADNTTGDHWLVWRSFVLIYKGDPLASAKIELAEAVAAAESVQGTVPPAAYNALASVVTEYNKTYTTVEEYEAAITAIQNATNTAKSLQANYDRYQTVKSAALIVAPETETDDADAAVGAATTTEAIDAAVATLRAAFLAELPNVTVPTDGLDVTAVMVDNASVRQNTDYWTAVENGSARTGGSWAVCNYNECEFYNNNFKFYQTLALTPGTWEFGVTGFHRAGNHNTNFYAGVDKILIPGVESSVVNTMAAAETYFNNGNGKVALKFLIETAGDVEIGIDNQDTQTDKWTIFRDFTLKYYGAPDYTIYENQWTALVTEANTAKTTNVNVTGTELTALNAAIADSPAGSNLKATYNEKISALQAALQAFNEAVPAYDKYVLYRAETVAAFGEELAATVAAPTSAWGANVAAAQLNIAQYNKVATDYPFSATGLIGDFGSWTGTATVAGEPAEPNYLSNEHWSGQTHAYYEQAASGWGNAGGWTIKYEKTCTLPAGNYVIKVAARTAGAGVTSLVSCSETNVTVTLPAESAYARGIKLNGEAGWDGDNSEYARDGVGFGWQWRFLPFTLTEQKEVTMTFYAEASTQYQWMSIADGELLSTTKLAEDVAYNETAENEITNTIIADVTIARNVKEGLNTVVLPFALTANQVTAAFGSGAEVYNFSEDSEDAMNATVNFTKGDGSIAANVPVLVKATAASETQTFNGVQIVAATEAKVEGTNFDFVGVYAPTTVEEGDYFVNGGKLYKSVGSTNLKAFRAYIDNKSNGEGEVKLYIDGVATAISEINADVQESGVIYNLAGQRVSKATRGIYVKNGRKVVVK